MQCYANLLVIKHSIEKATLYAKEFHTSKSILTFSIYLFHFNAGRKKIHAICVRTQIAIYCYQRWSPRGHILKSLALAWRPQVLKNCPVLGLRTALFLNC